MNLKADLYELREDGTYFRLSGFSGCASYMRDPTRRQLLRPGSEVHVPIRNADMTSKQIARDSRIVLMLSVSNSPWIQVNYGSGKDICDETLADGKEPLQIEWLNSTRIVVPIRRSPPVAGS